MCEGSVERWWREALRIAKRLKARTTAPPEEWDYYDEEYAKRKAGMEV